MLAISALWWAALHIAAAAGIAVRWSLPPSIGHGVLMTFGFMPMFFAGFVFTAGPKWLNRPPVRASTLLAPVAAQLSGWAVFMMAAHGADAAFARGLGAIGLGAVTIGWLGIVLRFVGLLRGSSVTDRVHARLIALACLFGAAGLCASTVGVALGNSALVAAAVRSSLWAFVGLVFATASHRMVPFYSAAAVPALDAWRPLWLLWCLAGTLVFEAAASLVDGLQSLRAGIEIVSGIGVLALAVRWARVQNLRIRLLAMLHIGFVWLGVSLVLAGMSHHADAPLRLASLHAYTMGFLGSTMLAMVTRVSCGHGGRTVTADDFIWRLFWVLQLAVLARLAGAIASASSPAWGQALVVAAAVGWAAVCTAWAARYGNWYGRPRFDGRPG